MTAIHLLPIGRATRTARSAMVHSSVGGVQCLPALYVATPPCSSTTTASRDTLHWRTLTRRRQPQQADAWHPCNPRVQPCRRALPPQTRVMQSEPRLGRSIAVNRPPAATHRCGPVLLYAVIRGTLCPARSRSRRALGTIGDAITSPPRPCEPPLAPVPEAVATHEESAPKSHS